MEPIGDGHELNVGVEPVQNLLANTLGTGFDAQCHTLAAMLGDEIDEPVGSEFGLNEEYEGQRNQTGVSIEELLRPWQVNTERIRQEQNRAGSEELECLLYLAYRAASTKVRT